MSENKRCRQPLMRVHMQHFTYNVLFKDDKNYIFWNWNHLELNKDDLENEASSQLMVKTKHTLDWMHIISRAGRRVCYQTSFPNLPSSQYGIRVDKLVSVNLFCLKQIQQFKSICLCYHSKIIMALSAWFLLPKYSIYTAVYYSEL